MNTWSDDLSTQLGSYIATVPVSGGPLTPLTSPDEWATRPDWSPTEDVIAFATHGTEVKDMSLRSTIETIKPDGTDRRTIWPGADAVVGRVAVPRWTPDGDHLIVSVATGSDTISDICAATLGLDGRLERIAGQTSGVGFALRPTP